MYTARMKRLQIYIDEHLDAALAVEAGREGKSKAALIRECVAARYLEPASPDPLDRLVGFIDGAPDDSQLVDDVVYSR
jgi:Ribbon-helix-helix protein, copG family